MMNCKVANLVSRSKAFRERQRQGLLRSWQPGGSHDLRFRHKEPDADTIRMRALYDRRGTLYASISKPSEDGPVGFEVRWSVCGRIDQVDVWQDGCLVATCRVGLVLEVIDQIVAHAQVH